MVIDEAVTLTAPIIGPAAAAANSEALPRFRSGSIVERIGAGSRRRRRGVARPAPSFRITKDDLQADIAADLISRGLAVLSFNRRSVAGILDMIRMLGASERAEELVGALEARLAEARTRAGNLKKRPRVFFEEWDDPLISGIAWVSELVGGIDIFANLRNQGAAKDRVVTAEEVVAREPDLIIGSWCGKKFRPERGDGAAYLRSNSGRAAPSGV